MSHNPIKIKPPDPISYDTVPGSAIRELTETETLRLEVQQLRLQVDDLKKIERDYQEIISHATEVIFRLDNVGVFTFVSGEFERMLQITPAEIIGKHFTSIVHEDDLQIAVETFEILFRDGRASSSVDVRIRKKDGKYKWVNCSGVCLFNEDGSPSHILGLGHEVTNLHVLLDELRSSEMALKVSEEKYRSLFLALGEGAIMINNRGEIIAANRCAERILGISITEMQTGNMNSARYNFIHEDGTEFPVHTHPGVITIQTGRSTKGKVMGMQKKDGSIVWISINTEPIYYSDNREKPDAVVASFFDITQSKNDKAELQRNQELLVMENMRYVEATKAVAKAVVDAQEKERAEIGFELHDNVNQLLTTARLYLDLAAINETERVNLIKRSSQSLSQAVTEIRNLCHSLVPSSLRDLGLVASIGDLVDNLRNTKTLVVHFMHDGDIEKVCEQRKLVIFRIIQEQVTNVLKHSGASELCIKLDVGNENISLEVSDNGKGFDKEIIKIKKGVGLHNITSRAELFNGKMDIISSPGNGCLLHILIPI